MPRPRHRHRALIAAFAASLTLAGCSSGAPGPDGTAKAEDEAFELSRPIDCAVKGGPWEIDKDALLGNIIEDLTGQGANITGGDVVGNYTIEFTADGHFGVATDGILVRTTWITGEGESIFYDETASGTASARWTVANDDGTRVVFEDWVSDLAPDLNFRPQLQDDLSGTFDMGYPVWDLSYRSLEHTIVCDDSQLTINLVDAPDYKALIFTN